MWYIINKNRQLRVAIQGDLVDNQNLPLADSSVYDIESNGIIYHMPRVAYLRSQDTMDNLVENDSHTLKVWIAIRKRMAKVLNSFVGEYGEIPVEPIPFSYKIVPGTLLKKEDQLYLSTASQKYICNQKEAILYPLEETIAKEPYYRDCKKYKDDYILEWEKKWIKLCLDVHEYKVPAYVCGEHSLYADTIHPEYVSINEMNEYEIKGFIPKQYYDFFKYCNGALINNVFKTDWKN